MPKYINAPETKYELSLFFICDKEEGESVTLEEIEQVIDRMESADVIEVKHGEWKHNKNNDVIKCSVCGFGIMEGTFVWKKFYNCCGTIEDNPLNFCPNCGADMRGEYNET